MSFAELSVILFAPVVFPEQPPKAMIGMATVAISANPRPTLRARGGLSGLSGMLTFPLTRRSLSAVSPFHIPGGGVAWERVEVGLVGGAGGAAAVAVDVGQEVRSRPKS